MSKSQEGNDGGEIDLMARLCLRDPDALTEIYNRYASLLYSVLIRITHDPAVSQDLLQETFLKLWNCAHRFDHQKGTLRVWLLTVTRNLALDHQRSAHRQVSPRFSTVASLECFAGPDPAPTLQRSQWMASALCTLPPHEKQVLELAYFSGYSQTEIAQILGEPLGTVKSWTRSALTHLRERVTPVSLGKKPITEARMPWELQVSFG